MDNETKILNQKHADSNQILQFLTTEHFALQTARSATVVDANGRANVFLTSVAGGIVALAFIGQASGFGTAFYLLATVLFPALFFLGIVTFLRTLQIAMEDAQHVRGISRIRHYYTEIAPHIKDYFVHSIYDDSNALLSDLAIRKSMLQSFATIAGSILIINSILAGVWLSLVARYLFAPPLWLTSVFGAFLFVVVLAAQQIYQTRRWEDFEAHLTVKFPSQTLS